ncbi:MAG: hypothetical protein A3J79_12355 [Elusimicrobia bacterium RIFOXYB2_FULL_62_6]|nr:MAG: hypothetical protein A3J79_12355 [Elusimicrobia bacterium RIFOXYB2_FULL_62_6]
MTETKPICYKYIFKFDNQEEKVLDIQLDPNTLDLLPKKRDKYPEWTALDFAKCPVCPYNSAEKPYCPIAVNVAEALETFADKESFRAVDVQVVSDERDYFKKTTLQAALSSVMGIYMASSGCSVMGVLKPMVRHHLPFASIDETMFRTVSTYLVGQYVLKHKGQTPDWDLAKLMSAYKKIEELNKAIVARFRKVSTKDANYNALIILDIFAKFVPMTIERTLSKKDLRLSEWSIEE